MNASANRSWLTLEQLAEMNEGAEVRLLAKFWVVFRKNARGTWDELPQSSNVVIVSQRQNVSSQTLCGFGVQDVV